VNAALARVLRVAGLALWRAADHLAPPPADLLDDYWTGTGWDNPDTTLAAMHPDWAARARHPSNVLRAVPTNKDASQ